MPYIVQDYSLRMYVKDIYINHSGKNGGSIFKPFYKKDLKPFQLRVKCAINRSDKVIYDTCERYPLTNN